MRFPVCFTEPHAGFKIAFNMFDADGNQMVDKREFLVVSVTAQNRKIYVGFLLFLDFFKHSCTHITKGNWICSEE